MHSGKDQARPTRPASTFRQFKLTSSVGPCPSDLQQLLDGGGGLSSHPGDAPAPNEGGRKTIPGGRCPSDNPMTRSRSLGQFQENARRALDPLAQLASLTLLLLGAIGCREPLIRPGTSMPFISDTRRGIRGCVTGRGCPIPGATVVCTSADGAERRCQTDEAGQFRIGLLPPGKYQVRFHKIATDHERCSARAYIDWSEQGFRVIPNTWLRVGRMRGPNIGACIANASELAPDCSGTTYDSPDGQAN